MRKDVKDSAKTKRKIDFWEVDALGLIEIEVVQAAVTPVALKRIEERLNTENKGLNGISVILKCETSYGLIEQLIDLGSLADSLIKIDSVVAVVAERWIAPVEGGCHYIILASKVPRWVKGQAVFNLG